MLLKETHRIEKASIPSVMPGDSNPYGATALKDENDAAFKCLIKACGQKDLAGAFTEILEEHGLSLRYCNHRVRDVCMKNYSKDLFTTIIEDADKRPAVEHFVQKMNKEEAKQKRDIQKILPDDKKELVKKKDFEWVKTLPTDRATEVWKIRSEYAGCIQAMLRDSPILTGDHMKIRFSSLSYAETLRDTLRQTVQAENADIVQEPAREIMERAVAKMEKHPTEKTRERYYKAIFDLLSKFKTITAIKKEVRQNVSHAKAIHFLFNLGVAKELSERLPATKVITDNITVLDNLAQKCISDYNAKKSMTVDETRAWVSYNDLVRASDLLVKVDAQYYVYMKLFLDTPSCAAIPELYTVDKEDKNVLLLDNDRETIIIHLRDYKTKGKYDEITRTIQDSDLYKRISELMEQRDAYIDEKNLDPLFKELLFDCFVERPDHPLAFTSRRWQMQKFLQGLYSTILKIIQDPSFVMEDGNAKKPTEPLTNRIARKIIAAESWKHNKSDDDMKNIAVNQFQHSFEVHSLYRNYKPAAPPTEAGGSPKPTRRSVRLQAQQADGSSSPVGSVASPTESGGSPQSSHESQTQTRPVIQPLQGESERLTAQKRRQSKEADEAPQHPYSLRSGDKKQKT